MAPGYASLTLLVAGPRPEHYEHMSNEQSEIEAAIHHLHESHADDKVGQRLNWLRAGVLGAAHGLRIDTIGFDTGVGMPAPVDSSGAPVFTNEALSKQIQASFEEGKREAFWVAVVNGVADAILELLGPGAVHKGRRWWRRRSLQA